MILVVGATGTLGGMVTRRLLAEGEPVRALVRDGSDYGWLDKAGAELVFGDLREPDTLGAAAGGMTRVLCTATAAGRPDESLEAVDREGVGNLIDAAEAAGVERFVLVSAYGFDRLGDVGLARAKAANEARLAEADLTHVILKPCAFMEVWIGVVIGGQIEQGPRVVIAGDGGKRMGFVPIASVADLAVAALEGEEAANRSIPLIADLASYSEIVEKIERVRGTEIEVARVDPGEAPPGFPPIIGELWKGLLELDYEVTDDTIETFGLDPESVEEYVQRTFGGQ